MERESIHVMGLCETFKHEETMNLFARTWRGHQGTTNSKGVGLWYDPRLPMDYLELKGIGEEVKARIIAMTLGDIGIIEAYAPVSGASEEERGDFYTDLNAVYKEIALWV
jgi:exonuclease III